jgi:tetratricopeptide (TPR) repeat protein
MTSSDNIEEKDPLDDYVKKKMRDPTMLPSVKNELQIMMASHLRRGEVLRFRGQLREALQEFEKEMERPIDAYIDAEIVESAYWQMGNTYRQLGEVGKAMAAYEKALELFRKYGVGVGPQENLAELYLEQGQVDEAIALCKEVLEETSSWPAKQLLAKALALKSGDSRQASE